MVRGSSWSAPGAEHSGLAGMQAQAQYPPLGLLELGEVLSTKVVRHLRLREVQVCSLNLKYFGSMFIKM